MTVDKSESSRPNSELQDYVESLLSEQPDQAPDSQHSNVTPLSRVKVKKSSSIDSKMFNQTPIRKATKLNTIELAASKNERNLDNKNRAEHKAENSKQNLNFEKPSQPEMHINKMVEPVSTIAESKKTDTQNTNAQSLVQYDHVVIDPRLKNVEKLLSKISLVSINKHPSKNNSLEREQPDETTEQATLENNRSTFGLRENNPLKEMLGDEFQTLVFDVNRLPLAVPLVKLGGIINISEQDITPLVGTPDWFMGLVPHEGRNLLVVDTQQFLMPEKVSADDRLYKFLIVLDDSNWALACHAVGDAKNLTPEQVRWSSRSSKRPWFAGMVLEYMSALLEVDRLINLLAENIAE